MRLAGEIKDPGGRAKQKKKSKKNWVTGETSWPRRQQQGVLGLTGGRDLDFAA